MKYPGLLSCILLSLSALPLQAQISERERVQQALAEYESVTNSIPHIDLPVRIDGDLSDPAWQLATPIDIAWQRSPVAGVPARSKTTAYIMADREQLYVGFRAEDPNPGNIPAFLRDRDRLFQDDYVGFAIDTNGDGSRAFEFFSNALGVQGDAVVDVIQGEDMSFDAIFATDGRITETGFEVEFAIPLNQLRFPQREGMQQWKMFFTRAQYSDMRYQNFQYPWDTDNSCSICQYQPFEGLEGAQPSKQFQLVPTFTSKSVRSRTPNVSGSTERNDEFEVGFDDIRWGVTPNISLNASINPDFSQLEADIAQLDVNTTQALFFPERRPFFLEGRDYFNSRLNLVNTRNISDPDFGLKLTGKVNGNVFGLMSARDSVTNLIVSDSESSRIEGLDLEHDVNIARFRHDFADTSYVGMTLTDRSGDDYSNTVVSVDGRYRINNRDTVQLQLVQTEANNPLALMNKYGLDDSSRGDAYRLDYSHNSSDWFWSINHSKIDADFRADAGFINQTDVVVTDLEAGRNWRGQPGAFINNFNLGIEVDYADTAESGDFLHRYNTLFTNIFLPLNTQIHYNFNDNERIYNGQRFNMQVHNVFARSNISRGLNFFAQVLWGDQIDFANTRLGETLRLSEEVNYNLNQNILLQLRHTYSELDVDGGNLFKVNLTDLRMTYRFNVRSALKLTTIYSDLKANPSLYSFPTNRRSKSLDAQLLFSYQLNPQSELFAGYATSGYQNDQLSSLERSSDGMFLKLSYAWQL